MRIKTGYVAVLLPLVAPLLAFAMVLGTSRAAEAVAVPTDVVTVGTAVTIGGTAAGAQMTGGAATAFGACAVSVVCAGITGGVILGLALWQTQDTWLPLLPDALEEPLRNLMGNPGTCKVVLVGDIVGGQLQLTMSATGCTYQGGVNGGETLRVFPLSLNNGTGFSGDIVCKDGDNIYTPTYNNMTAFQIGTNGVQYQSFSKTVTMDPCLAVGGALVYWRGVANIAASAETTSNILEVGTPPEADQINQTTTVTCRKPDGSTGTVSKTFVGQPSKVVIPSCEAAFGAGAYPLSVKMTSGYAGAETPLLDRTWTDPKTEYPDCFHATTGAFLGTCTVQVWVNGEPCEIGMGVCTRWETYEAEHPGSNVQCKFGPYLLSIGSCSMLKGQYNSGASTKTITVTDPVTGLPQPGTGTKLPTWVDNICMIACTPPEVGPDPPTKPETNTCLSGAKSWNPVHWVFVPVKCVLIWAFVPTSAPSFTDLDNPIPGGWIPDLPSASDSSCGTLTFPELETGFNGDTFGPTQIVDTCDAPWPTVRAFTYYGVLALVMVPLGFKAFNMVLSALGMYLGVEAQIEGINSSGVVRSGTFE